jgi:hypothetical protein
MHDDSVGTTKILGSLSFQTQRNKNQASYVVIGRLVTVASNKARSFTSLLPRHWSCGYDRSVQNIRYKSVKRNVRSLIWQPLWSSGQSSWLLNRDVLCFLWGTNWIYICYVEESRPPLWSSGHCSWLHNGDVLCFLWGTNWMYICYVEESRPLLLSSCQSSWLLNGDVLCFLWGTNWIYICYIEESKPPLWSSGQSSWLQIQRSGFDSRHYQIFWEVVGLERGPLSLVSTTEELLGRNCSGSSLENQDYCRWDPPRWPHDTPLSAKVGTNFSYNSCRSVGIVRSRTQATEFFYYLRYCTIHESNSGSLEFVSLSRNQRLQHSLLNSLVQWLELLFRILKVMGLKLGGRPVIVTNVLEVYLSSSR